MQDCAHALKLRHSVKVDSRTRLVRSQQIVVALLHHFSAHYPVSILLFCSQELGLDLGLNDNHGLRQTLQASTPWAAMLHQLEDGNGAIELNPLFLSYNRKYQLGEEGKWYAVPLDTKLGLTYRGT